jgi:hypothetical protein
MLSATVAFALVRGSSSIIATIDLSLFDPIIMTDFAAVVVEERVHVGVVEGELA